MLSTSVLHYLNNLPATCKLKCIFKLQCTYKKTRLYVKYYVEKSLQCCRKLSQIHDIMQCRNNSLTDKLILVFFCG